MGGGASLPEVIDRESAKSIAGDQWDGTKFDAISGDRKTITREQFIDAQNLAQEVEPLKPAKSLFKADIRVPVRCSFVKRHGGAAEKTLLCIEDGAVHSVEFKICSDCIEAQQSALLRPDTNGKRVTSVAYAAEQQIYFMGMDNGQINKYNALTFQAMGSNDTHRGSVNSLVWVPGSRVLLSIAGDNTARQWRLDDDRKLGLCMYKAEPTSFAYIAHKSPAILVGLATGRLYVTDMDSAMEKMELKGHQKMVVDVHVVGGDAVSCSTDQTIKWWKLSTGDCIGSIDTSLATTWGTGGLGWGTPSCLLPIHCGAGVLVGLDEGGVRYVRREWACELRPRYLFMKAMGVGEDDGSADDYGTTVGASATKGYNHHAGAVVGLRVGPVCMDGVCLDGGDGGGGGKKGDANEPNEEQCMWSWGADGECVLWRPSSVYEFAAAVDPVVEIEKEMRAAAEQTKEEEAKEEGRRKAEEAKKKRLGDTLREAKEKKMKKQREKEEAEAEAAAEEAAKIKAVEERERENRERMEKTQREAAAAVAERRANEAAELKAAEEQAALKAAAKAAAEAAAVAAKAAAAIVLLQVKAEEVIAKFVYRASHVQASLRKTNGTQASKVAAKPKPEAGDTKSTYKNLAKGIAAKTTGSSSKPSRGRPKRAQKVAPNG
jgi:hypothetical protein